LDRGKKGRIEVLQAVERAKKDASSAEVYSLRGENFRKKNGKVLWGGEDIEWESTLQNRGTAKLTWFKSETQCRKRRNGLTKQKTFALRDRQRKTIEEFTMGLRYSPKYSNVGNRDLQLVRG